MPLRALARLGYGRRPPGAPRHRQSSTTAMSCRHSTPRQRHRPLSLAGLSERPRAQGDISVPALTALMCLARCGQPPAARC